MAAKKESAKKKVTKKETTKKKSTNKKAKKIEKVVEEVNLIDETEEKAEPNTELEVMNGDPSVITPIEEPLINEPAPIEEPTPVEEPAPIEEPKLKKKIMRKINRAIGYFWNGQMMDF